jgi:hypothetical protein
LHEQSSNVLVNIYWKVNIFVFTFNFGKCKKEINQAELTTPSYFSNCEQQRWNEIIFGEKSESLFVFDFCLFRSSQPKLIVRKYRKNAKSKFFQILHAPGLKHLEKNEEKNEGGGVSWKDSKENERLLENNKSKNK